MRILAIDPGVTTGVAELSTPGSVVDAYETDDMPRIAAHIERMLLEQVELLGHDVQVVVERYLGAGFRDRESVQTLKVWGFCEFYARRLGLPVALQAPQRRKGYLDEAIRLVGGGHHYTDALAHALAFASTRGSV